MTASRRGVRANGCPARYRQNLQVYVSTLRRALEPGRVGGGASRIVGHREAYELVVADDEVDATRLGRALETGRSVLAAGRPGAAAATAQAALADWRERRWRTWWACRSPPTTLTGSRG